MPSRFFRLILPLLLCVPRAGSQTLETLFESGPKDQRINIVVLSEGYTAPQLVNDFRRHAAGLVEAMLAREPYATYRNYFNAYAIAVASNQSGADYPDDDVERDTYFNSSFGTGDLARLLYLPGSGESRAYSLLSSLLPQYDIPLVLVNDPRYGGSGGPIAVASMEERASEVVIHEVGHSFAGLVDEYDYPGATAREGPNTTQITDRSLIRWRHWIASGTPLPTPETSIYVGVVGLFEGAAYEPSGWYRPMLDSLMLNLDSEFGPVNEEAIVLTILERLPQITSAIPAGTTLASTDGQPLTFRVQALQPAGSTFSPVTWYVDGAPVSGAFPDRTLVARGSQWKYSAASAAPAAAWKTPAFDDATWSSGPAPLGFGETNLATTVPGGPSGNRFPAIYFRHGFTVQDPGLFQSLQLELRRDDGAVVYLNGVELYRSNMASGAVTHTRLAASNEGDASEDYYYDATLSVAGLVAGLNVLAVEVHQNSLTSSDLRFDLALRGRSEAYPVTPLIRAGDVWKYRDNGVFPGAAWTGAGFDDSAWLSGLAELGYGDNDEATPVGFGSNPNNRFVTTWFRKSFTIADPGGFTGLDLTLLRDDGAVVYLNGTEVARSNLPEGAISPATLADRADDDGNDFLPFAVDPALLTAGNNVVAVEVHQNEPDSSDLSFDLTLTARRDPVLPALISSGSAWRYWDRGAPPAQWQTYGFDDAGWVSGAAPLGYGNGGETTVIGYGGSASNKHSAAYFRHAFDMAAVDPASKFRLRLRFDDGAAVYLNGTPVVRANLPSGTVDYAMLAGKEAPGDGNGFTVFEISAAPLVTGRNVLAVEVHQATVSSSDLVFDLELRPLPPDTLTLLPAALGNGPHTVEARYVDPSGKVLQDPQEFTVDSRRWTVNVASIPADSDSDGLPDTWEQANFGNLSQTPAGDADNDGATNADEFAAGTHPAQGASRLEILSASRLANGKVRVRWSSVPGKFYHVQSTANAAIGPWNTATQTTAPATFTEADIDVPQGTGSLFLRIKVLPP